MVNFDSLTVGSSIIFLVCILSTLVLRVYYSCMFELKKNTDYALGDCIFSILNYIFSVLFLSIILEFSSIALAGCCFIVGFFEVSRYQSRKKEVYKNEKNIDN